MAQSASNIKHLLSTTAWNLRSRRISHLLWFILLTFTVFACEPADENESGSSSASTSTSDAPEDPYNDNDNNVWNGPQQGLDGTSESSTTTSTDDPSFTESDASSLPDDTSDPNQDDTAQEINAGGSPDGYPAVSSNTGAVILYEYQSVAPSFVVGNATAHFGYQAKDTEPKAVYASCHVAPTSGPLPAASLPSWDAGDIDITGTVRPITLRYSSANAETAGYQCSLPMDQGVLFQQEGSPIVIRASGGQEVDPFAATLTTPAPVTLVAPPLGFTKPINTESALTVQWIVDNTATNVTVTLVGLDNLYNVLSGHSVQCVIDGDTGSITVPADAMKQLPKGFGTNIGIAVTRFHTTVKVTNDLPIELKIARATAGVAKAL